MIPRTLDILLRRTIRTPEFTLGEMFVNGNHIGYTCEDADRRLECGGEKVRGRTAIPCGRYKVILSFSNRFGRIMPEVLDVPGFSGVRIHGGNTAADTLGCPLLGSKRADDGVRDCAAVNVMLSRLIGSVEREGGEAWLTVQ